MLYYRHSLGDQFIYCKITIESRQITFYFLSNDNNQWSPLFIQKGRAENADYLIYEITPSHEKNSDVITLKFPKPRKPSRDLYLEFRGQSIKWQSCLPGDVSNNPAIDTKVSSKQLSDSYNELCKYLLAITSQTHRNIKKPQTNQERLDILPQREDINAIKMEIRRLENNAKSSFWGVGNQRKATKITEALIKACNRKDIHSVTEDAGLLQALATHRFGFFGKTTALKNVEKTLDHKRSI